MTERSTAEQADHLSRRRARLVSILALLFIANQGLFLGRIVGSGQWGDMRAVDAVQVSAWLVWAIMLMILLATGGGFLRGAKVRALLNDETTCGHRAEALAAGFWALAITAVLLYLVTLYKPIDGRLALHIVLTFGVGTALLRFGKLERAALADG